MLRSLLFNIAFYAVLIGMMIVGLPVLMAGPVAAKRYAQRWARASLWLLRVVCGVQVDIRGLQNLPDSGVIVAAKHQSFLDIIVLVTVLPRFVFVLKRELTLIPLFGQFVRRTGMIPVDRSKGRAVMGDLTARVRRALSDGQQLIIFPEGTRRSPGAEPSYKSGVSHLYAAVEVPCVPVALNSGLFWPRRSFARRRGLCVVEMLPAIPPGRDRMTFLKEVEQRIEAASNRLLSDGEAAPQGARASAMSSK